MLRIPLGREVCASTHFVLMGFLSNLLSNFFYNLSNNVLIKKRILTSALIFLKNRIGDRENMEEQLLQIQKMLPTVESTIKRVKKEANEREHQESCGEIIFEYLLTFPATLRKIPGMNGILSEDMLEVLENENQKNEVKRFFADTLHVTNGQELREYIDKRYRTNNEYQDFLAYWSGTPHFAIEELDERGQAIFRLFMQFASNFKDTVGEHGFAAFDLSERMNLIRVAYAAGMIEQGDYISGMRYYGHVAASLFDNWDDYIRSYICGSAYFMFTMNTNDLEGVFNNLVINNKLIENCDFYRYGWLSKEDQDKLRNTFEKESEEDEEEESWKLEYNEPSYMVAVVAPEKQVCSLDEVEERVMNSSLIHVVRVQKKQDDDSLYLFMDVVIEEDFYRVMVKQVPVEIPKMFRMLHLFKDLDLQRLEQAKEGIEVTLCFGKDKLKSYHDQLKLLSTIMPDALAFLDAGSEKILSAKWVHLAAKSNVPPAPRYLFTVQAVGGGQEDGEVWLHTHGLNRCNIPELEVLGSDNDFYNDHYNIIELMAKRFLDGVVIEEKEPLFLAHVTNEIPLVATILNYKDALKEYVDLELGTELDREDGHDHDTYAIFCYPNKDCYDQKRVVPINVYDELLSKNPLFMISNEETARMRALAQERVSYMKDLFHVPDNKVLVKVGLLVDEEHREKCSNYEHIYFELQEIHDDYFKAVLTQEPYYIEGLHTGAVMDISYKDITDWIVFTKDGRITPDDVYMID